jgi:ABC-2 type transport system ATP-binding protein
VIDHLHKQFRYVTALKALSLVIKKGEIFGLLGANGAGKTTLIKILVGILKPSSGTLQVLGGDPAAQRHQIGYMPQAPALYEELSPRENVRFFGQAHDLDRLEQRIDEVLTFTDLRGRENEPVYTFSGGMKQRVSLACALVHQPRLLLLDEPTAGIDPRLRQVFWSHFRELAAQGVTILVSTHQMDEVMYCDRVAVMREGILLACDTPQNLLWRGKTTVKIWRGEKVETEVLHDYPQELPRLLNPTDHIDRIEVHPDSLETIILAMISEQHHES